jgi:hypothetical protein
LSYQETTRTKPSSREAVERESKIDEWGLPMMSLETRGSAEYSTTEGAGDRRRW